MENYGALFGKMIRSTVGNNLENEEDDVKTVKNALSSLGYYKRSVENGIIDQELDTAIHIFQKDNNLKVDGYMKPGGETERELLLSLNNKAEKEEVEAEKKEQSTNISTKKSEDPQAPRSNQDKNSEITCQAEISILKQAIKNMSELQKQFLEKRREITSLEKEIKSIDDTITQEKKQSGNATKAGALIGLGMGTVVGSRIGGSKGGKILGGAGKKGGGLIGKGVEELADFPNGTATHKLIERKNDIQKEIAVIREDIDKNIVPNLEKARENYDAARESVLKCQAKKKVIG